MNTLRNEIGILILELVFLLVRHQTHKERLKELVLCKLERFK